MSNSQASYGKIVAVKSMNLANFVKKNFQHFIILGILGIYLLSINSIYTNKVLVYGKPTSRNPDLPEPTQNLKFSVDRLEPTVYGGEELYKLIGFAFDKTDPNPGNKVMKIVLHSVHEDLVFDTEVMIRRDVTRAFPEFQTNLERCGFRILVTKHALRIDNYQVGIYFEDLEGNPLSYQMTGNFIERSPNSLRLIVGP